MSKTIALFGATGGTGRQFLEQALAAGHSIRALARTPSKVVIDSSRLELIEGDVLVPADVDRTVAGCDLVVSLFGHVKDSPEWLQTRGTENILAAMREHGVERIISLSGGGLPFPEKDEPKFLDKTIRFIMKLAVPKILDDAIRHAEVLRAGDRDWTIVRGPRLTDESLRGEYRVGWMGVNAGTQLGRADLAHFILGLVEEPRFSEQMPFVSY